MPRYEVEIWETRSFIVPVEAASEDEAIEIAEENFEEMSVRDSFVSIEFREIWKKD